MASIREEISVQAKPAQVWDAVRDVGALHRRLVPGFVTDCQLEDDARIVTFANGMVVRERIVDIDEAQRRVVWSAVGEQFEHHNASVQVFDAGDGRTRLVWIADLLPDTLHEPIAAMVRQAMAVMHQTLERAAREQPG